MREHGILYERTAAGEYFHAYSESFADRFFFEIVQRGGDYDGYGALNAPARMASQVQRNGTRMTDRYAVIGNPVAHSQSPRIHAAFARALGHDVEYGTILRRLGRFATPSRRFRAAGGRGLNVTVPFKLEAFALADDVHRTGARRRAPSTRCEFDGDMRHRRQHRRRRARARHRAAARRSRSQDKRVLLIGAGGAARGVVGAAARRSARRACDRQPHASTRRTRWPRSSRRRGAPCAAAPTPTLGGASVRPRDQRDVGEPRRATRRRCRRTLFAPGALAYDMVYGDAPTPFLASRAAAGAAARADGLGMLVEQAAESFLLWRGVRPDTRPVLAALRP